MHDYGAAIICGGNSSRMGRDKATLPFGPVSLVERVSEIVGQVVPRDQTVCVAAQGQALPELPDGVRIARDRLPNRGPLEGLAVGLSELNGLAGAVYVTSCDAPLLVPAFIRRMFEMLGDFDIAVPHDGRFHHPLAAVYRVRVLPQVEQLLADNQLQTAQLFDRCRAREVPVDELRDIDSELHSLFNCNQPEDYHAALRLAGFRIADDRT